MATRRIGTIIQHLRQAALGPASAGMTDGQLLESFIACKDDETFGALMHRHGPMVMGVCGRILRNHHDAEDAFQATFLVLARKASSIRPREQVANWLHGVACRTALKARTLRAKTQRRESQVAPMPEPEAVHKDPWTDLQPLLDEELNRLPEIYRLPVLLCDLECKSIKEATQQLGWPQGTLAGRLSRGRKMLAKRLRQRGVLSGGALAVVLSEKAVQACVPTSLAVATTKAAIAVAAGQAATANLVSAKVAALMEGVIKGMLLTKLKTLTIALLALGTIAFAGAMMSRHVEPAQHVQAQENKKPAIPQAKTSPRSMDEQKLHGEWIAKDNEIGNVSVIFGPGQTVRRISENGFDYQGTYSVDWSKNPLHLYLQWRPNLPAVQTIMEFVEAGKLRIESGATDKARPKAFTDKSIILTRKEMPAERTIAEMSAARDIGVAEFHRRTGHFGSAYFYYQLVQYRYPNTEFARKASQGLEDLKKHRIRLPDGSEMWEAPEQPGKPQPPPMIQDALTPNREVHELRQRMHLLERRIETLEVQRKAQPPATSRPDVPLYKQEIDELRQNVKNLENRLAALEMNRKQEGRAGKEMPRIAKIIILGNGKLTEAIRQALPLVPGQILDVESLRNAEKKLAAFDATIEVVDINEPENKDILIRVKQK